MQIGGVCEDIVRESTRGIKGVGRLTLYAKRYPLYFLKGVEKKDG